MPELSGGGSGDQPVREGSRVLGDQVAAEDAFVPESATHSGISSDLSAIWNELMSLKELVENEHNHKLRRIETDLRWTMMLVGAQFVTIIGSALATLVGG